ncbi:MAG: winged helix-turn-helix transcriptional regulator [Planctomycetes bacterium]|nr:winged helix-turn-helix transcriptional regulator [Planctomycetota bacterium]MCB9824650.1 winged helix-turn-helix transcriptional regulator [Planctomycetota bacterium]MCB9830105.1 winged helix-turn-helix transcriptional regulator [Planctomycetota bacterium]MCB9899938.1 winged helix-turn-helix transcriptional regulator [Planctomycetota bacterium]
MVPALPSSATSSPSDPASGPLPEALLERVASRFRALGAPSRLRILSTLMDGPLGMGELMAATGLELSNLSRHVQALEQDGCVVRERHGREVTVRIGDPSLAELCTLVCAALGG